MNREPRSGCQAGCGLGALGCLLPVLLVIALPWLFFGSLGAKPVDPGAGLPTPPYVAPAALAYEPVSEPALLQYLKAKHSALATAERVHTIVDVAQEYRINPLLLVAIAGQEQSFVPADEPQADTIVANVFNVFGCWCWYHPGLRTAAAYAADTVVRLLRTVPPPEFSAIHWLNTPANPAGEYATDPHWWVGVSRYFAELQGWPGIVVPAEPGTAQN